MVTCSILSHSQSADMQPNAMKDGKGKAGVKVKVSKKKKKNRKIVKRCELAIFKVSLFCFFSIRFLLNNGDKARIQKWKEDARR